MLSRFRFTEPAFGKRQNMGPAAKSVNLTQAFGPRLVGVNPPLRRVNRLATHSGHVRLETPPDRPGPTMSPPDPETPPTRDRAAAALALGAARDAMARGDDATAMDTLETFDRDARDPEVSFTLGVWTMNAGDPERALDHFRNAAHLAPGVAEVFINIAAATVRLGRPEEAVEAAQRAIALAPDRDVAHGALGNAFAAADNLKAAESAFLEAHARAPTTLSWMLNLGDCLLSQVDPDAARTWFNRATEHDPTSAIALNGLGLCHQAQADHAAAISFFEKALAQQDQYPEALGNLGVSLQCLGRHEDALVVARRSVELAPSDSGAALNLGHILQSLGRHTEAVETYQNALEVDPMLPGARAYLLHSRRHICAWDGDADLVAAVIDDVRSGGQVPPFALAGTTADPETRLIAARRSAEAHRPNRAVTTPTAASNKQSLRIGFVSPDFRTHSLAMSFSSVLAARNDPRNAWIGYSIAAAVPATLPPSSQFCHGAAPSAATTTRCAASAASNANPAVGAMEIVSRPSWVYRASLAKACCAAGSALVESTDSSTASAVPGATRATATAPASVIASKRRVCCGRGTVTGATPWIRESR